MTFKSEILRKKEQHRLDIQKQDKIIDTICKTFCSTIMLTLIIIAAIHIWHVN